MSLNIASTNLYFALAAKHEIPSHGIPIEQCKSRMACLLNGEQIPLTLHLNAAHTLAFMSSCERKKV